MYYHDTNNTVWLLYIFLRCAVWEKQANIFTVNPTFLYSLASFSKYTKTKVVLRLSLQEKRSFVFSIFSIMHKYFWAPLCLIFQMKQHSAGAVSPNGRSPPFSFSIFPMKRQAFWTLLYPIFETEKSLTSRSSHKGEFFI